MVEKVVIVADGDPSDPATWSGTPRALLLAFRELGVEAEGYSCRRDDLIEKILAIWSYAFRSPTARFRRYFGLSHRRAQRRWRKYRSKNPETVAIHTAEYWLDPRVTGPNDFLYRDVAWGKWAEARGLQDKFINSYLNEFDLVLQRLGGIFTTSDWARRHLLERLVSSVPSKTVFTGLGQPIEGKELKTFGSGKILFVGKVRHEEKGLDLLIRAMSNPRIVELGVHLLAVIGTGYRLAPSSNISVFQSLSVSQLAQLFQESDLFVMPARNEPFGLVYVEAMRLGIPIIGPRSGAFPELVGFGKRGIVLENLSPDEIASSICSALEDRGELERMSREAQAFASTFSWTNTAKNMIDLVDATQHQE